MPLYCHDNQPGVFLPPAPFVPFQPRKAEPERDRCQRKECGRPAMEHWVVRR